MRCSLTSALAVLLASACAAAGEPGLAFKPAEAGHYTFDTGVLRGKIRVNGKYQGIIELVHAESGAEVAHGGKLPGLLSYYRVFSADTRYDARFGPPGIPPIRPDYRVFSAGTRYGAAARDWPTVNKLLPDGALEVFFPAAAEHPLEMTGVYRWARPDTLDVVTTVKPQKDMPRFELFMSSYFMPGFKASVYVKPSLNGGRKTPALLDADSCPLVEGTYLMFPRDRQSILSIFDGRWELGANPVQWSITSWLAGPLAVRRNEASGVAALMISPPEDCFAIATPYNRTPPDGVAGHLSLYQSLFGGDVKAGETASARQRLVVKRNLSDQDAVGLYQAYLAELKKQ